MQAQAHPIDGPDALTADHRPVVLCVDDEPLVLEGLSDSLRHDFEVVTATSGADALQILRRDPTGVQILISDIRMPGMSGTDFLAEACRVAPDAVRVVLTGYAELEAAVAAVNDGHVFRFLTKPCPREKLLGACAAALGQYRLVTAERELLEETLSGCVTALTEVLALANPAAFGRAARLKNHALALAAEAGVESTWELEIAAMLSQIAAVTLSNEAAEALYLGRSLEGQDAQAAERLPGLAAEILESIPRLEGVREILRLQSHPFDGGGLGHPRGDDIPLAARMLKVVSDWDALHTQGQPPGDALESMRASGGAYDPELLTAFEHVLGTGGGETHEVHLHEVELGMVFAEDVRGRDGVLLVARGHEVTPQLADRISHLRHGVCGRVRVLSR